MQTKLKVKYKEEGIT